MESRDAKSVLQYIQQERPPTKSWKEMSDKSPEFTRLMEEVEKLQVHYNHASAAPKYKVTGALRELADLGPQAKRTLRFSTDSVQNEPHNPHHGQASTAVPPPASAVRAYEQLFSISRGTVSAVADTVRRRLVINSANETVRQLRWSPTQIRSVAPSPTRIRHAPSSPDFSRWHRSQPLFSARARGGLQSTNGEEGEGNGIERQGAAAAEGEDGAAERAFQDEDDDEDDGQVIGQVCEEDFFSMEPRQPYRNRDDGDEGDSLSYDGIDEEEVDDSSEPNGIYLDQTESEPNSPSQVEDDMAASERLARELMEAEQAELLERLHSEQQRALAQLRAAGGEAQQWLNIAEEEGEDSGEREEEGDMDYDQLLELGERLGDVRTERWRQRSAEIAAGMPTLKYCNVISMLPMYRDDLCVICQFNFEEDEDIKLMPNCTHSFHADCADQWIKDHDRCATCKALLEASEES